MSGHLPARQQSVVRDRDPEWAREFQEIMKAYELAGGKASDLENPQGAMAVISSNRVLGVREVPGLHIEADELEHGVRARISVEPGTKVDVPVHLCFGVIPTEGLQEIISEYDIGDGAEVSFLAHCTFPNSARVQHVMDANIHIGEGATMKYSEAHYHGKEGGVEVLPTTHAKIDAGGRLSSEFDLTVGRVGKLDINYEADVGDRGIAELVARAYGSGTDDIRVNEVVRLNGEGARGMTKTRIAVKDKARSAITTTAEGNASGAVGHMDCTEIVRGDAIAQNIPIVVVRDDQARVTHEAAIGSVNSKELETLKSRGLDEDEAVDIIIQGMLA